MLRMKTLFPTLALLVSFTPMAANARGADTLRHQQVQQLVLVSGPQQAVSFNIGRAAERPHNGAGTTHGGRLEIAAEESRYVAQRSQNAVAHAQCRGRVC
jgi:hypothetical protein